MIQIIVGVLGAMVLIVLVLTALSQTQERGILRIRTILQYMRAKVVDIRRRLASGENVMPDLDRLVDTLEQWEDIFK